MVRIRKNLKYIPYRRVEIDCDRNNDIIWTERCILHPALLYRCQHHRNSRKKMLAVPLNKCDRWRADADNQVRLAFSVQGVKVFDECRFRAVVA